MTDHDVERRQRTEIIDRLIEGGAGTGQTLVENERSWKQYAIRPRVFRDVSIIDMRLQLFGREWATPVAIAPSGGHQFLDADGILAVARASKEANVLLSLAHVLDPQRLEDVAPVAGPYLQQLYLPRQREKVLPFLARTAECGALAILLTVDNPRVAALQTFREDAKKYFAPPGAGVDETGLDFGNNFPDGTTLDDVAWLTAHSPIPVLVKGVLCAQDARDAIDAGARGVVVSNHGGREVDYSITAAEVLESIRAELGPDAVIMADGGIRDPHDVFVALALGATAALVGRPVLRALRAGGCGALFEWLEGLRSGIASLLASAGYASTGELKPDAVHRRVGRSA